MAVPEQIPLVNYVADGTVKKFDVPFDYDQQADLHLFVDGVEPTIDKYFFEDNAFNFYIAPTVGQKVRIERITPKKRDTDYDLHTNTVRPKALNSDFDRIWYALQESYEDFGELSIQLQNEIIARIQSDDEILAKLAEETANRILGDTAVSDDLKNYIDQMIALIIGDPSFSGINADKVLDESGLNQQEINDNQDDINNSQATKNSEFSGKLLRQQAISDKGFARPALGYNPVADAEIYDQQASFADQSLLMNGSMHLSKKFRGIRRNADVFGVRGGRNSVSNGLDFDDQVVGVSNARGVASYGMNDGVSIFADATLPKLEAWESVSTATYTTNTVTIDATTYAETLLNAKIGDVIQTLHATKCWGIVTTINATTGVITVDEWATNGTTTVTPTNGVGFNLNLISKVWGLNVNVMINADSSGVGGVVAEMGLQIKKSDATVKNGMDMVLLPGSTANGEAAFLSRGTNGFSWNYGYMSQGNQFNYYSSTGARQPLAGYAENSNAVVGVKFFNQNTYSMLWSTSTDQSSISIPTSPTIFSANGTLLRQPKSLQVLSASGGASEVKTTYLLSAAGITVTLPPKAQHVAGHWYEFVLINTGSHSFNGNDANINGVSTYTFNNAEAYTKYTAIYDGNSWIMYKG